MKHTSHPYLHQIQLARDLLLTDTSLTPNTFLPLVLYSSTLSNCYKHPAAAAAAKSLQSCPTLHDPMDCSLPGSSVRGIFQARVLEWGAIAFSDIHPKVDQLRSYISPLFFSLLKIFDE